MNEHTEANRRHWEEIVPIHATSEFYGVDGFKSGELTLGPTELEELGDVSGKSLLHLQCHFGLDTLSWARKGAVVTGIDFSPQAIETAQALAAGAGIDARFMVSDLYSLPERLDGQFDIVFTSKGVLCWLPDITRWAQVAAHFVRPGGTFYLVEFHPFAMVFDGSPDVRDLRVRYRYFHTEDPERFEEDGTYADLSAHVKHQVTYEWRHTLGDVVSALVDTGLRIEFLHEFPYCTFQLFPFMEPLEGQTLRLTKHDGSVPLLYSIKATKPETSS